MEEHIEIKKQILTELKDWLTETGFNSNVFLKKLKQPIKDQLSNLSEDDIFFSKPFEIEGYFATYIMEIITRFTHSDGTYGDSYMEPLDEYNPNCEVFTKEFNHLCLNEQRMVTDVGDQSKFDHGIELVTDYVKKEFRRRNQRDLYNYPRVIIKTQIKK